MGKHEKEGELEIFLNEESHPLGERTEDTDVINLYEITLEELQEEIGTESARLVELFLNIDSASNQYSLEDMLRGVFLAGVLAIQAISK